MIFIEDDHMIGMVKAIYSNRADHPFDEGVLPGTTIRRNNLFNSHVLYALFEIIRIYLDFSFSMASCCRRARFSAARSWSMKSLKQINNKVVNIIKIIVFIMDLNLSSFSKMSNYCGEVCTKT